MASFITILSYVIFTIMAAISIFTYYVDSKGYKNSEGIMRLVWSIKKHNSKENLKNICWFYVTYICYQVIFELVIIFLARANIIINSDSLLNRNQFPLYFFGYLLVWFIPKIIKHYKENKNVF